MCPDGSPPMPPGVCTTLSHCRHLAIAIHSLSFPPRHACHIFVSFPPIWVMVQPGGAASRAQSGTATGGSARSGRAAGCAAGGSAGMTWPHSRHMFCRSIDMADWRTLLCEFEKTGCGTAVVVVGLLSLSLLLDFLIIADNHSEAQKI